MSEEPKTAAPAGVEAENTKTEAKWTNDDLIDLIRAVKFSNKDASIRMVHTEITTKMASNESFEYLSEVKLNDVKKVWKKAVTGPPPQAKGGPQGGETKPNALAGTPAGDTSKGGILKFYTVGDGSKAMQSLAKDYTNKAAAEVAADKAKEQNKEEEELGNYVHCFLDVPMDVSGTRPHQALINFNRNKGGSKKKSGKGKKKGKDKATTTAAAAAGDESHGAAGDDREIVKIQNVAAPPGGEAIKYPMLLYNSNRSAKTFIHPGDDTSDYDKIQDLILRDGVKGVLTDGGTKAYFYCHITRRKAGQDIVSIDVTSGLAPAQTW